MTKVEVYLPCTLGEFSPAMKKWDLQVQLLSFNVINILFTGFKVFNKSQRTGKCHFLSDLLAALLQMA